MSQYRLSQVSDDDYLMFVRMLRYQYGARATAYAAERRVGLMAAGDTDGVAVWGEVIRRLQGEMAAGQGAVGD